MNKENLRRTIHTPNGVHLRESEGKDSRTIEGYAILFNVESRPMWTWDDEEAREVILPEAISREFLDECDIKFTMFHDRQILLARSDHGKGTLSYNVDAKGVSFQFDAPNTIDGDKAIELVKRGDIKGCSFAFSTHYADGKFVEAEVKRENDVKKITYKVKKITGIYDMTLAADPAYPATSAKARELRELLVGSSEKQIEEERERANAEEKKLRREAAAKQIAEMKKAINNLF